MENNNKGLVYILTNTRLKKSFLIIVSIFIINFLITFLTGFNIIVNAYSYIDDLVNGYDSEIKNVEIKSNGYDDNQSGTYKVTKSAEWIESNKIQFNIDVDTNIEHDLKKQDLIIVLDTSLPKGNNGVCNDNTKNVLKALSYDIINSDGKVSLITMNKGADVLVDNTKNVSDFNSLIDSLSCEDLYNKEYNNYFKALQSLESILKNRDNTNSVNTLFITDGYPNKDTPNEKIEYELLKRKYESLNIIGIVYNLGDRLFDRINDITDESYVVNDYNFKEIVMDKVMNSNYYKEFQIKEYLNAEYYNITDYDIKTSVGETFVSIEDHKQVINWKISENELKTGASANLEMYVDVADNKKDKKGYYNLSTETDVISNTKNDLSYEVKTKDSVVLKHGYDLKYEVQAPSGCQIKDPDKEYYYAFSKVSIVDYTPVCDGYTFAGWKVKEPVKTINSGTFIMPDSDVTVKGTWVKTSISTTAAGTIHETATIFKAIEGEANKNSNIDFSQVSSDTNGKGVYEYSSLNTKRPIYYYRGNDLNNHLEFANMCFRIIRTTDQGNIKLIYDGKLNNGVCNNKGEDTIIGFNSYNLSNNDIKYNNYIYGDNQSSEIKNVIDKWYNDNLKNYDEYLKEEVYYYDSNYNKNLDNDNKEVITYNSKSRLNTNDISIGTIDDIYKLKVGTITSDEVVMAGSNLYVSEDDKRSSNNYLINNVNYWTMSSASFLNNSASNLYVDKKGSIKEGIVSSIYGVRPVIAISGDLEYTGTGTSNDPYKLDINVKTLASLFKVGDYVKINSDIDNYLFNDTNLNIKELDLYRVIKNDNGEVIVVSDNISSNKVKIDSDLLNSLDNISKQYLNSKFTISGRALRKEDLDLINHLYEESDINYWVFGNSELGMELSIRPILILKNDVIAVSGNGTNSDPWIFE